MVLHIALSDLIVITFVAVGVLSASTDSRVDADGGGVLSDSDSVVDAGLSSASLDSGVDGSVPFDSTKSKADVGASVTVSRPSF